MLRQVLVGFFPLQMVLMGIAFAVIFLKDGMGEILFLRGGSSIYFWHDRWCDRAPLREISLLYLF